MARVSALDLLAHAPGDHQRDHLVVADERPERVLEGGRTVVLDEEVADPRGGVAGHEREGQPAPAPRTATSPRASPPRAAHASPAGCAPARRTARTPRTTSSHSQAYALTFYS